MPKLVFHDSDGIDKTVQLGLEPVFIGRASDCQIQTHDAMVSRKHARITWEGGYWIEDLGSANGVFLGADKVTRAPMRPGDVVTCGSLVVRMMPETRRPVTASEEPRVGARTIADVAQREFDEDIRTSANPALAGAGDGKLKADLQREVARREQAEQALLHAEERAASAEGGTRELVLLRRRVEQLATELEQVQNSTAPGAGPSVDRDEVAEAVAVFNDSLAELKSSLRAAVDEADLLTAPAASVRVVRESMRSAMDELERARGRLREMNRKLGLRDG